METIEFKNDVVNTIVQNSKIIYVKPYYKKYKCYCTGCGNSLVISKQQLKEIHNSHMCPMCWRKAYKVYEHDQKYLDFVNTRTEINCEGYMASFTWSFDHAEKIRIKHVAHFYGVGTLNNYHEPNHTQVRDIHIGMFGRNIYPDYEPDGKWKKKTRSTGYFNNMIPINFPNNGIWKEDIPYGTKKDYLDDVIGKIDMKSSQKKIAIDHILSPLQIKRMVMFDLNDYEDVRKMNFKDDVWWNDYDLKEIRKCQNMRLNKFDAEYVRKNKLKIRDFIDYIEECNEVGIKNKHPKDFQHEHSKVSAMVRLQNELSKIKKIDKRYAKHLGEITDALPKFSEKGILIQPVMNLEELSEDATYMSNCIMSYALDYINGKCFLFIVRDESGTILANVEIRKQQVIQCRARFNQDPSPEIKRAVKKMVRTKKDQLLNAEYIIANRKLEWIKKRQVIHANA